MIKYQICTFSSFIIITALAFIHFTEHMTQWNWNRLHITSECLHFVSIKFLPVRAYKTNTLVPLVLFGINFIAL